ncbi:hypothetical protein ACGF5O_48285 [Streptomyces sp. NPDC048291]|uniref:hypothetical protein n=1 Tax=Streptomyces sp. NPDC048291 TaxID=3365530 RepID=UPI0037120BAD
MRLTIDTETDTYEQAIAAVQAAFGLRPGIPAVWLDAPAVEPRPGPQDLADGDLADGWTDQLLFHMIASLAPGARAVLRRITELGGAASYEDVQHHFASHPASPIPLSGIGGTLTSVKAVQRRVGPEGAGPLLQRDERARRYRIDDVLVAGLQRAFALADTRPTCCAVNRPGRPPDRSRSPGRRQAPAPRADRGVRGSGKAPDPAGGCWPWRWIRCRWGDGLGRAAVYRPR